mgnify:CR=1 FL=1
MKNYTVNINGHTWAVRATTEKVAISKVLRLPETKPRHVAAGRLYYITVERKE